jgi:hypothetical protein
MTTVVSTPAVAREAFSFSFDTGNVAFAYSDGYWDHDHHWHKWRNAREGREYRARFSDHYDNHRHTHMPNKGWRDNDHDGVPNRFDDRPNNPYRR